MLLYLFLLLIVLPLVEQGGEVVRLDVQMALKPPVELGPVVAMPGPAATPEGTAQAAILDRTRERMRTVSSGARVRLGDAVVFTVPQRPDASGASIQHEEWLVVRIRSSKPG